MEDSIYGLFLDEMQKSGFEKIHFKIQENDVEISGDDESIYIVARDCRAFSIRGIRESKTRNIISSKPHSIYIKAYDYNGEEAKPNDAVRFSIIEVDRSSGLPTDSQNRKHIIFYHYPYSTLSGKKFLGIKKGIVITKDKKLEIKIIRNGKPIKIGKLELIIECDKWIK